jgi:hypothetical protein
MSSQAWSTGAKLPAVDARLVEPETRYEMHGGELAHVSPADPPHGSRHLQLCALIEAHTGPEFEAACDLLTRTSEIDDVAPDVSVYPEAYDPETGGRQIEELAFEVVSTQSLGDAGEKAAKLVARGVRRVFAIDITRSRVLEWSAARNAWRARDAKGHIIDPALVVPLPIDSMIRNAKADDAIARALLAKRNPVLVQDRAKSRKEGLAKGRKEGRKEGLAKGRKEGLAKGRKEGRKEGLAKGRKQGRVKSKAEAVIMVLIARGVVLDRANRKRILGEHDSRQIDRWIVRAATCENVSELFRGG